MKILVIDDSKETTALLSEFFSSKGFEITVSNDPMEGLNHIRNKKFDVILLDISMPVITGFGIIELLAGEDTLKDQNIFIFSATTIPEIQLKNLLRRDGINGVLRKPMELDELLTAITN
jgi:CheY-like chemotaxis protein